MQIPKSESKKFSILCTFKYNRTYGIVKNGKYTSLEHCDHLWNYKLAPFMYKVFIKLNTPLDLD
jgi:hypothetical protein